VLTRLQAGRFGIRIPAGAINFSLQNAHTGSGAYTARNSVGTGVTAAGA
jgi:hypothetical protein